MNDIAIARKYISKFMSAHNDNIEFTLSFTAFKNMMKAQKCGYIGIKLTTARSGKATRLTDRTIDRIDNKIGYVSGNVIAVCHAANKMKAIWENPNNPMTAQNVAVMLKKLRSS